MTRKTKLRIKVPIPPFGTEKAKIVIENDWGPKKQQSDEEVIFDYIDFCKELYTPETKPLPFVTITQIATAYDQCIDTLSDLYCSPTTSPTGQAPSGTPPPKVSNFIVDKDNIYLADEYELSWDLQGIGIYRLYMRVKGNNKLLKEENFTETTRQQKKYSGILIDSLLTSDIENVEFVLTVFDKDAQPIENGVLTKTIQILRLPEVIVPPKKEFVKDNDPSDAKKEIYYLSQNVADRNLTLSDYQISNLNIDKRKFNSKDLARENMGSFWILNDEETKLVPAFNKNTSGKVIDLDLSQVNTRNSIRPATGERYSATFGGLVEAVPFDINTDLISGDQVLFWLNNSFPSNSVTDILYSYQKPYTKKEALQMLEKPSNFSMIEEKSEYNFYKRKYEEIHFDIDENLLPNMYFISLNRDAIDKRGTATKEDDFELDPDIGSLVSVNDSANSQASKQPIDIKMYYDYYIKQQKQNPITDQDLIDRAKNIYIPYNFLNKIDAYNANSEMHPMKIEISFTKPARSTISSLLKNSEIGEQVMLSCLTKFQKNETVGQFETIKQEFDVSETNYYEGTNRYIGMNLPMDLTGSSLDEFVYLGDYRTFNNSQFGGQQQRFNFEQFTSRLHYIIKDKTRTYKQILEGKACYRETLYYRIAKYSGEQLIQNIWVPNDPDKNSFKYIDTQVKYDKKYKYRIYTYDFVLGNSYYSNQIDYLYQYAHIINRPNLLLVENIFDEIEAKVKDLPPLHPSIDIHPYIGVDNKLLFFLGKNFGIKEANEVIIRPDDAEVFNKTREAQKLEQTDLIKFGGDDIIKEYEIFRLDEKPKSYKDFESARTVKISTLEEKDNPERRKALVSFIDSILPNKEYYYTFRCTDIHDQLSNPTDIIQIKMVNENGTIFLLKNIYDIKKQSRKEPAKQFKRFLMLKPDTLQETFKIEQGNAKNALELREKVKEDMYGSQEEKIWNKKYKLRLVSKNTNKVYDINFKFGVETKIIE